MKHNGEAQGARRRTPNSYGLIKKQQGNFMYSDT